MNLIDIDPKEKLNVRRIEALSDGVFAIVMTLLIFDIKAPVVPVKELPAALWALYPHFIGYIVSFALLGIYWMGHMTQLKYIQSSNHNLNWINIIFFATVALLPFSTRLIGHYPQEIIAILLYSSNLIIIGMLLFAQWYYATNNFRLIDDNMPVEIIRYGKLRSLAAPVGYLMALFLGFIDTRISLAIFVIIPLAYIIPHFQKFWLHFVFKKYKPD